MIAAILCGGKGLRLRPLTNSVPKPLLKIKEKPILEYLIDYLACYDVKKIIFASGYKSECIEKFVASKDIHVPVDIVDSGDVDLIQRIKDIDHLLQDDFFVFYGDTLSDLNLNQLYSFHKKNNSIATVSIWPLKSQFGLFDLNEHDEITSFTEKPTLDKWINIGHFCFSPDVLPIMDSFKLFEDFLSYMVLQNKLLGFKHYGKHITVNTLQELQVAEDCIENLYPTISRAVV